MRSLTTYQAVRRRLAVRWRPAPREVWDLAAEAMPLDLTAHIGRRSRGIFANLIGHIGRSFRTSSGSTKEWHPTALNNVPYRIDYSPEAVDHLAALTARESATVLDVVDRQLRHEPMRATRNRKVLRANPVAPWELRTGRLRVYYEVREEPERVVVVKAVGVKDRDRVRIGGEEVTL